MLCRKLLEWFRRNVPQKVRFAVVLISIFPVVFVLFLAVVLLALLLACGDLVVDAYKGHVEEDIGFYVVKRVTQWF